MLNHYFPKKVLLIIGLPFFSNAVFSLDINRELNTDVSTSSDPVISAIERYKNHPS